MAIKNDILGGSDFIEEPTDPDDFNDTFDAVINQLTNRKEHTDNTEYTQTGSTWSDKFNFTFGELNALLVGIIITCEMKISSDSYESQLRIKLSGTNLGTKYINAGLASGGTGLDESIQLFIGATNSYCLRTMRTNYTPMCANLSCALKLLDAVTTVNVGLRSGTSGTAYLDTFKIQLVYMKRVTDE